MNDLEFILKQYWGFDRFLPLQREAMNAVMAGRDSLVVLPTGGGKSLCFQAPAMALPGMAIVVSPLISLMKDQVDSLRANGIPSARINSGMAASERQSVNEDIRHGLLKLLYVSPERLVQPAFLSYIQQCAVSFFVVDEAHCISHWGHDFRPEYRELRHLREALPKAAIHAYTATATEHVRDDIVKELCLREPEVLVGSFDRPNLVYHVERRARGIEQVRRVIEGHPGESGIVYCIRRAEVDAMCDALVEAGYRALPYHAGMPDEERKANQEAFTREQADIVVATVAFGMGIDKSNVRYVIHAAMPKSIEYYHQETGRGGRDGLEAECWLFHSGADYGIWKSIVEKGEGEARDVALSKLSDMFRYCTGVSCRHKTIVTYFGQQYPDKPCGACDVCLNRFDSVEGAGEIAKAILDAVQEIGAFAGPTYTATVLSGSREDRVVAKGHDRLQCFGQLAGRDIRTLRDWIAQLAGQGYLEMTGEYNLLSVTSKGLDLGRYGDTPQLARPATKAPVRKAAAGARAAAAVPEGPYDQGLFEALRQLRREKADELGAPPFVVFSDAALRDMARRRPRTKAEFLEVHGVGKAKCQALGDEFLAAIFDYTEMHGAQAEEMEAAPAPEPAPPKRKTVSRRDIQLEADALFEAGCSIEEACERLQRRSSTVEGYLETYIETRGITDSAPWVSGSIAERIREAVSQAGGARLKPVWERLEGEASYGEIRIVLACLRNATKGK